METITPAATVEAHDVVVLGLEDVRRLPRPRLTAKRISLDLAALDLSEATRESFERRLSGQIGSCGCREGTMAGLIYLLTAPLVLLTPLAAASARSWGILLAGVFASMVAGKLVGLTLGRYRLQRVLQELEQAILDRGERLT